LHFRRRREIEATNHAVLAPVQYSRSETPGCSVRNRDGELKHLPFSLVENAPTIAERIRPP
jgi:hypothetical protein